MKKLMNDVEKDYTKGWDKGPCMSHSHQPPMHLYIPPGESFTHVCPSCGAEVVLKGTVITC